MSGSFWGGMLLALVVVLLLVIWSIRRHRDPDAADRLRVAHRQADAHPVRPDAGHGGRRATRSRCSRTAPSSTC